MTFIINVHKLNHLSANKIQGTSDQIQNTEYMRNKITPIDYWIEILTSTIVVVLHIYGVISLAVTLLGLVICLSISLPLRRNSHSRTRQVPPTESSAKQNFDH